MTHAGCHISIRNGYAGAARTAVRLGATAFQYFPKNPRGLAVKEFDPADAAACAAICREHGIRSIAHTTYATNLAAEGALREPTVRSLRNDLDIADACESIGVVVHFGKWKSGHDPLDGYKLILSALNETLDGRLGVAKLLIENQAGEGTGIGTTMEELTSIRSFAERPEMIGFCLDTCHLFASGVWDGTNGDSLLKLGRDIGFFTHLMAVHVNDSVYPAGSRRDRHANIGRGAIGEEALGALLRTEELASLPLVLETPVIRGETHAPEIALLRSIVSNK